MALISVDVWIFIFTIRDAGYARFREPADYHWLTRAFRDASHDPLTL
ncbi:MAG: hypothetical protein HOJ51_10375 [Tateyamaria sp.]|nr:hypothetical protein [Tateyamaria sp.]